MSSKCKGCGAEVKWVFSENNKKMILNAKPERRVVLYGHHKIGKVVDTYESHWATCPKVMNSGRESRNDFP